MAFSLRLTGVQETVNRLREFDKKMKRRWLMKAARAGAKPVKAAMIRNAPQDKNAKPPNTWRKSIGTKIKMFAKGTVIWFAVGPRSAIIMAVQIKVKFFRGKDGRLHPIPVDRSKRPEFFEQKRRPVLYSHLIEDKQHTIERTADQTRAAAEAAMRGVLEEAVGDV